MNGVNFESSTIKHWYKTTFGTKTSLNTCIGVAHYEGEMKSDIDSEYRLKISDFFKEVGLKLRVSPVKFNGPGAIGNCSLSEKAK